MRFVISAQILSFVLLLSLDSAAGVVDSKLAARISQVGDEQKISCVIMLKEQFDTQSFKKKMNMSNSNVAQRHAYVVNSLREIASNSQGPLLARLETFSRQGLAADVRGWWIVNAVTGDLSASAVYEIARDEAVEGVYLWEEPTLIKPVGPIAAEPEPPVAARVEIGLQVINAHQVWAMGYTGDGRLVANIDTGVDGTHPALAARWRGNNGQPANECWLDTANPGSQSPYDSDGHGTHTMGTMTGLGSGTGDTIGVAFGAQWIASRAIVTGGNVIAAFQWLADPDGDPLTIDDVPDVISNSWGYHDFTCPQTVWAMIDNCEAAEVAVIFAAGNRLTGDPYVESVWAPASRITTPFNTFSVGAVNGNSGTLPIADFSARGPSQCDHSTIKPEVVAPGVDVRSSVPGGGYQQLGWSGTSMACPHVAGAIALLRQFNPNASVDTLKWALWQSARDLGSVGEDNNYGKGIINIRAALDLVPANDQPYIRIDSVLVVEPHDNYADPGDTIGIVLTLKNTGAAAHNVIGLISSTDPFISIAQDSAFYGDIPLNGRANNTAQPYSAVISAAAPAGRRIILNLNIQAGGYSADAAFGITVGRPASQAIATHNAGNVDYTISNFGQYGLAPDGMNPNWQGRGFRTPRTGTNYLFEGALLIGNSPTKVSNAARDENQGTASDFLPLSAIQTLEPGPVSAEEFQTVFNDQLADQPLNVMVNQTTFSWSAAPNDRFIITRFRIINTSQDSLAGLRVAIYQDWDIPYGSPTDRVNFDRSRNLGYQYSGSNYRGVMVLNLEGAVSFKALHNSTEVYPPRFTLADKWTYMTSGFSDTAITAPEDASLMLTTGVFDIAPGDSIEVAFAVLGQTSLPLLQQAADAAYAKYHEITAIADDSDNLPHAFHLTGNYPNPFNSNTSISFSLIEPGNVRLEVFDILGRRVKELAGGLLSAGHYSVIWDGRDNSGGAVASGVYFLRLSDDKSAVSRKILLLR